MAARASYPVLSSFGRRFVTDVPQVTPLASSSLSPASEGAGSLGIWATVGTGGTVVGLVKTFLDDRAKVQDENLRSCDQNLSQKLTVIGDKLDKLSDKVDKDTRRLEGDERPL